MSEPLIIAIPSKGRLKEQAIFVHDKDTTSLPEQINAFLKKRVKETSSPEESRAEEQEKTERHLRRHEAKEQLVVAVEQSGRVDDVRVTDGAGEIENGDAGGL